jgi:hypothetical protein
MCTQRLPSNIDLCRAKFILPLHYWLSHKDDIDPERERLKKHG